MQIRLADIWSVLHININRSHPPPRSTGFLRRETPPQGLTAGYCVLESLRLGLTVYSVITAKRHICVTNICPEVCGLIMAVCHIAYSRAL